MIFVFCALSRVKVMLLSFNTKHGLVYKLQNRHIMQNYDLLFQSTKAPRIYSPEVRNLVVCRSSDVVNNPVKFHEAI